MEKEVVKLMQENCFLTEKIEYCAQNLDLVGSAVNQLLEEINDHEYKGRIESDAANKLFIFQVKRNLRLITLALNPLMDDFNGYVEQSVKASEELLNKIK